MQKSGFLTTRLISFQDLTITVYFSDRVGGSDDVFVGEVDLSYDIRCNDIQDSGVHRIVSNQLANT